MPTKQTQIYLFFHENLDCLGGVQTLVARSIAKLEAQSKLVLLIKNYSVNYKNFIKSGLSLADSKAYGIPGKANQVRRVKWNICTFEPVGAAAGYAFGACIAKNRPNDELNYFTGIYHPREYFRENEKKHVHLLNRLLIRCLPEHCFVFMNSACLETHRSKLGRSFSKASVIPVPVEPSEGFKIGIPAVPHSPSRGKISIVSVGRLVPFKAYNHGSINITQELLDSGIDVKWDIYGEGPEMYPLNRKLIISGDHIVKRLTFKGPLPYHEFANVVPGYQVFVGMGTAAVEAAQLGLPVIVSIDNSLDETYGFIFELPFGNVGEELSLRPRRKIRDLLEILALSDPCDVMKIREQCRTYVQPYRNENYIDDCLADFPRNIGHIGLIFIWFYLWLARPNWLRMLLGPILKWLKFL